MERANRINQVTPAQPANRIFAATVIHEVPQPEITMDSTLVTMDSTTWTVDQD